MVWRILFEKILARKHYDTFFFLVRTNIWRPICNSESSRTPREFSVLSSLWDVVYSGFRPFCGVVGFQRLLLHTISVYPVHHYYIFIFSNYLVTNHWRHTTSVFVFENMHIYVFRIATMFLYGYYI